MAPHIFATKTYFWLDGQASDIENQIADISGQLADIDSQLTAIEVGEFRFGEDARTSSRTTCTKVCLGRTARDTSTKKGPAQLAPGFRRNDSLVVVPVLTNFGALSG